MAENFLSKENTDVLWEVLADDDSVPKTSDTQETFVWLLPRFHASHQRAKIDLMSMNKLFIGEMMEKLQENMSKTSPPKNTSKPLITSEDLKSDRLSEFDKELKQKETDFQFAMTRPVPEEPNFKDNFEEKPLGDVSQEIERMMKERNLEISSIQKKQDVKKAEEWISSTNPSLRSNSNQESIKQPQQDLKFIKIDKDDLEIQVPTTNLDEETISKSVSWDENLTINISKQPSSDSVSIFSKLKTSNGESQSSEPKLSSPTLKPPSPPNVSNIDSRDMEMLFSFFNKRFDKLEEKIDSIIPRPHPSLMDTIIEDDSEELELGDLHEE